jgi:hypothetical protein
MASTRILIPSATNELREVIGRFDNEPSLRGEDFADETLEAISSVGIISCSRVGSPKLCSCCKGVVPLTFNTFKMRLSIKH